MESCRERLFQKRHFAADIIVTCVLVPAVFTQPARYRRTHGRARLVGRSHHHLALDPNLCARVQRRLRDQLKPKGSTWHIDETFVKIAGRWLYLFRAVDSSGQTLGVLATETGSGRNSPDPRS
jgi:transposase-like protein